MGKGAVVVADKVKEAATAKQSAPRRLPQQDQQHRLPATATGFFTERTDLTILFVAKDFSRFSSLVARLRREQDVELVPAATGASGLEQLKGKRLELVIVDEQLDDMSGIEFVKQLVKVNPLANTAVVGSLADEDFHEATEGLGVLMQLPAHPDEKDGEALLAVLAKIAILMQPVAPKAAS